MRREDWRERLADAVARHAAAPFDWRGSHCFALVMDACQAMTGEDPHRGAWRVDSERQAQRRMLERGYRDVADALAAVFLEVAPACARTGDAVIVADVDGSAVCGLVLDLDLAVRSRDGFARLPRTRALRAFAIG
jgi:hypothetical protein